jgi:hypothetical protein
MTAQPGPSKYPILDESTSGGEHGEWKHNKCGTVLLGAEVAHAVHDGLFPLSGGGDVEMETVPYCPTCEDKPSFHGRPITRA